VRDFTRRGTQPAYEEGMQPLIDTNTHADGRARRNAVTLAAAAALLALAPHVNAQRAGREPDALHGSKASVEKMYDFAQRYRYPFYLTPTTLDDAIAKGKLVPLTGDENYELTRGVGFSYSTVEAREFITQFAPQYLAACGVPLTVTSAARPMSRQPRNANPHSVHPTGIAVDIRRPFPGPCLTWVRNALAQLEERGYVEATEEHHPVHLHIAVLRAPGARFTLPDLTNGVRVARQPTTPMATPGTPVGAMANGDVSLAAATNDWARTRLYMVRDGDTLWDVAQKTGVSVNALARVNNRSPRSVLRPGTTLKLPDPATK
jgi:LysM repeat protein